MFERCFPYFPSFLNFSNLNVNSVSTATRPRAGWSGVRIPGFGTIFYSSTQKSRPWCRVLLEKLTGLQLVKKFTAFHGTRRFITALTSVRHLSLSWVSPVQSIYPHPTSRRSILILSTHLRLGLPSGLFPSGFPTKNLYTPSPHPYAPHSQPISFFPSFLNFSNLNVNSVSTATRFESQVSAIYFTLLPKSPDRLWGPCLHVVNRHNFAFTLAIREEGVCS